MKFLVFCFTLLFCWSPGRTQQLRFDDFAQMTPANWLEAAWELPVLDDLHGSFGQLYRKHPNSAEGLTAKAYILTFGGQYSEAEGFLKKALAINPKLPLALYVKARLAGFHKEMEKSAEAYLELLSVQPGFYDYNGIRNLYFLYKNDLKSLSRADAFLKEWEQKRKDAYVFDFIRGIKAESANDYALAEKLYMSAVEKDNVYEFDLYERLINLRIDHLADASSLTPDDRIKYHQPLIELAAKHHSGAVKLPARFLYKTYLKIGDLLYRYNATQQALQQYMMSYSVTTSSEMPNAYFVAQRKMTGDLQEAVKLAERTMNGQTTNYAAHKIMGDTYYTAGMPGKAENSYKKAVEAAPTAYKKYDVLVAYADNILAPAQRFQETEHLFTQLLKDGYQNTAAVYEKLYMNSYFNSRFSEAASYLRKAEKIRQDAGNINQNYFTERLEALDDLLKMEKEKNAFYTENPFNDYWQKTYGEGVKVHINFPVNSAAIPSSDYDKLKKLASVLSENGADDYRFRIEGHTDNTGTDQINIPLSQKRAKAVADYLGNQYKIPAVRMEVDGFGSTQPAASNETENGRTENRRVDILLSANIKKPLISATTTLLTDWLTFSNDGKYFVTGYAPLQLWDAEKQVKLRDFKGYYRERWFSPNGRYVAAISGFPQVENPKFFILTVIDIHSGNIIDMEPIPESKQNTYYADWNPFSNELAISISGYDASLLVYSIKNKKVDRRVKLNDRFYQMVTWANEKYIVTAEKGDKGRVFVHDANSLQTTETLTNTNWPHVLGHNADGTALLAIDNNATLHTWNLENFEYRNTKVPLVASTVTPNPYNNDQVLLNDWTGGEKKKAGIFSLAKMDFESITAFDESTRKLYFKDAETIAAAALKNNFVELLSNDFKPKGSIYGESETGKGMLLDEDQQYVITFDGEGIHVWDATTGSKSHFWDVRIEGLAKSQAKENTFLATQWQPEKNSTAIIEFNTKTFTQKEILSLPLKITHWGPKENVLLFAGTEFTGLDRGTSGGQVLLYDAKTMTEKADINVPLVMAEQRYDRLGGSGFQSIDLSPDKKRILVSTHWVDGYRTTPQTSQIAREIDLYTGKTLHSKNIKADLKIVEYLDGGKYRLNNNEYGADHTYMDLLTAPEISSPIGTHNYFSGSREIPGLNLEIAYNRNLNMLTFSALKKSGGNEHAFLNIAIKRKNEWIAYSETGEYSASLHGTNKVFWLLGNRMLEFEALKNTLERPDLIRNKLQGISNGTIVKNTDPVVEPEVFELPYDTKLLSPDKSSQENKQFTLALTVTKKAASEADPELVYRQNGRKIVKGRGFEVVPKKQSPVAIRFDRDFELQEGYNLIEVMIRHKEAEIPVAKCEITFQPKNQNNTTVKSNQQLWFFGVGVSKYQKPEQNLEYADKDILAIAEKLSGQNGKLYGKVNVKTLVNEEATERNVRIQLNDFLKMASAEDLIIIYVAGHGVQDNEQNLYFMTHDAELGKPYTGMQVNQFQSFLRSRPINQKALFLMDICHAGTVSGANRRGAANAEDAIKQLSEGTGTIVFASSTGKQSSLESEDWGGGHGAFSWALLLGLDGEADIHAGNKDGLTSVLELQSFVSRKVPELTDGAQHPTTPESFNVKDFPIMLK